MYPRITHAPPLQVVTDVRALFANPSGLFRPAARYDNSVTALTHPPETALKHTPFPLIVHCRYGSVIEVNHRGALAGPQSPGAGPYM